MNQKYKSTEKKCAIKVSYLKTRLSVLKPIFDWV